MSTKVKIELPQPTYVGEIEIGEYYVIEENGLYLASMVDVDNEELAVLVELKDGIPWDQTPRTLEELAKSLRETNTAFRPVYNLTIKAS